MAENTTDLDAVMQAAERLRRYIHAPSDVCPEKAFREVYGGGTSDDAALGRYQDDVADFLGAILPKGKRPEPVPEGGEWTVLHDHTGECYATDEESTLVLHWEAFIDFTDRLRSIRGD